MSLDVRHNLDGSFAVELGAPFCATVTVSKCNGRRRYVIEAPESTRIDREVA